jgi:hypothetical protein
MNKEELKDHISKETKCLYSNLLNIKNSLSLFQQKIQL